MKIRKCHKCQSIPDYYTEFWNNHTIEFNADKNGIPDDDGNLEPGEPVFVQATCSCGHQWKLRGVKQIDELKLD